MSEQKRRHSSISHFFKQIPVGMKSKRKDKIPVALREAVWTHHQGRIFEGKCLTTWCPNIITVFDFQCGHDVPESKGGPTTLENLYPLCSRCNLSMGARYTYKEWCALSQVVPVPVPVPVPIPVIAAVKRTCWSFFSLKPKRPLDPPRQPSLPGKPANK